MKILSYELDQLFAAGKYEDMVALVADKHGLPRPPFRAETLTGKHWCRVYIYAGTNCNFYDRIYGFTSVEDNLGELYFSTISTL